MRSGPSLRLCLGGVLPGLLQDEGPRSHGGEEQARHGHQSEACSAESHSTALLLLRPHRSVLIHGFQASPGTYPANPSNPAPSCFAPAIHCLDAQRPEQAVDDLLGTAVRCRVLPRLSVARFVIATDRPGIDLAIVELAHAAGPPGILPPP